jgi:hypothetical protein
MANLRTLILLGSLAVTASVAAQPEPPKRDRDEKREEKRDRRRRPPDPGSAAGSGSGSAAATTYDDDEPAEEPPALKAEAVVSKPGFVWIAGHWQRRAGKWEWIPGHHERERAGKQWRAGRWEKRGAKHKWIAGGWEDVAATGDYPKDAPPPPQAETPAAKAGFVWIPGKWEWRKTKYEWVAGHFERERAGKKWRAGRWDKDGDRYKYVDGDWEDAAASDEYPKDAPPPPQNETSAPKPGFLWIPGKWEWRKTKYEWIAGHYERERAGKKWRAGRWDKDGDRYKYVEGDWVDEGAPTDPPRPRRDWKLERPTVAGFFPSKGKAGARIVVRGKNFAPDATVLWSGKPVAGARITPDRIVFAAPADAVSGAISIKVGRRELQVGAFEIANVDAAAEQKRLEEQKKLEEEARLKAEAEVAARAKAYADAAARRAAVQKAIDERAANRQKRRDDRIAELRAKWDREFIADTATQDELVLHAYRIANLARLREIADLTGNAKALVRIELASNRENVRHEDRMTTLKAAFKGGKP